jgi:hypothetical protein
MAEYFDHMHVTAFSSPREPQWRWRISDSGGQVIEESPDSFASISAAVAAGTKRLVSLNIVETTTAMPLRPWGGRHGRRSIHV